MADMQLFLFVFVSELVDDFVQTNDILEANDDDMVVLAAVSCYMQRKLTHIHDYFEATIPRYLPEKFKNHFIRTGETCKLLCQEVIQTGCIPVGNLHWQPVIAPEKKILAFLWRIANQEPARTVGQIDLMMECHMEQKISSISKFRKQGQPRGLNQNFRNKLFEIFRFI